MQLNIEKKRNYAIVHVTGEVLSKEIRLVYDAIKTTFQTNRTPIILNLSGAKPSAGVPVAIAELQLVAFRANSDLIIVGTPPPLSQFPNIKDAEQLLSGGSPLQAIREKTYAELLSLLERKVEARTAKLKELEEEYLSKTNLPEEIEMLRALFLIMSAQADELLKQLMAFDKESLDAAAATSLREIEYKIFKVVREGSFQVSEVFLRST